MESPTPKNGKPMLGKAEDAILVARAVEGDTRAFEALVRRHGPIMRAYAIRLLGSTNEAEDVVQNAFITAWRKLASLKDHSAVRAWLMTIVSHGSVDVIRAGRSHGSDQVSDEMPLPSTQEPERVAEAHSAMQALSEILDQLSDDQRQCWLLREVGGFSYAEIADRLEMSHATVRGTLVRVRATILREMEAWR